MTAAIQLAVPATSANLGPGFDRFGLAHQLYLTVTARPASDWSVVVRGQGAGQLASDASNLIVKACLSGWAQLGAQVSAYHLEVDNPIPVSRGLGSSATAIVAGLALAQASLGGDLDRELLFQQAATYEGHPDNVAPAIFGGLCLCSQAGSRFSWQQGALDQRIRVLAVIPGQSASTEKMRGILPHSYADEVLAANAAACDRLLEGLAKADPAGLRASEDDQLHQPYRLAAMPICARIYDLLRQEPLLAGAFLSGSGATVGAWVVGEDPSARVRDQLAAQGIDAEVRLLIPDRQGLRSHTA